MVSEYIAYFRSVLGSERGVMVLIMPSVMREREGEGKKRVDVGRLRGFASRLVEGWLGGILGRV